MATAFTDGEYEKGSRADAVVVPEPGGLLLLMVGAVGLLISAHSPSQSDSGPSDAAKSRPKKNPTPDASKLAIVVGSGRGT